MKLVVVSILILLAVTSPGGTIGLGLLALYGLYLRFGKGRSAPLLARIFYAGLTAYLLVLVPDILNGGGIDNFRLTAIDYLPLLVLAPVILALREIEVDPKTIDRGIQITMLVATAASIWQYSQGVPRPQGLNLNPIPYGFILSVWGTIALARGLDAHRPRVEMIGAALLALVPILLTGSRLAWGTTLLGYGIVTLWWFLSRRRWKLLPIPILLAAGVLYVSYETVAGPRVDYFWSEFTDLLHTGQSTGGSLTPRVEMATAGFRAFLDRPLLGYGFAERMSAAAAHASSQAVDVTQFGHLHNDYVTHLVAFGVSGIVFLGFFLGFYLKLAFMAGEEAYRRSGVAIVAMVALYMGFEIAFNMDPLSSLTAIHICLLTLPPVSNP
jgi:O-antigen ligase